jgi:hypothetical protein
MGLLSLMARLRLLVPKCFSSDLRLQWVPGILLFLLRQLLNGRNSLYSHYCVSQGGSFTCNSKYRRRIYSLTHFGKCVVHLKKRKITIQLTCDTPETEAQVCSRMLTYAHVCSRMLTYADVCSRVMEAQVQGDIAVHNRTTSLPAITVHPEGARQCRKGTHSRVHTHSETLDIFQAIQRLSDADIFVGKFSSGVSRLIAELGCARGRFLHKPVSVDRQWGTTCP